MDLEGQPQNSMFFVVCNATPKSALEGTPDVGFGGATGKKSLRVVPPNPPSRAPSNWIWRGDRRKKIARCSPSHQGPVPSTLDLEGQADKNIFRSSQIQRPGRPQRWIWGGRPYKYKNSARLSKSNVEGALKRGFGGQHTETNILFSDRPSKSNVEGALERGFGGATHKINYFFSGRPSKSNVEGALERGFGGATDKKIFFLRSPLQIQR